MKKLLFIIFFKSILLSSNEDISYINILINNANKYREYVHYSIVKTSSYIDNYYFEKKHNNLKKYNEAYGLIEISAYKNHSNTIKFDQKLRIKLKLPKIKEKMQIVFESDEQRDSQDYIENHKKTNKDKYNLSLLYNKNLKDIISFKGKLGLKINRKFDPFIKIEAKKTWYQKKDQLKYILSQSLKESVDKRLEATSYFNIIKTLNNKFYISIYNEYYWNSPNKSISSFYNSISLNQELSKKNYLTYRIDVNTNNEESSLKTKRYSFQIKYRHFIKKWLYVDTIPENFYKREENFKSQYGIRFNLGVYFNK